MPPKSTLPVASFVTVLLIVFVPSSSVTVVEPSGIGAFSVTGVIVKLN